MRSVCVSIYSEIVLDTEKKMFLAFDINVINLSFRAMGRKQVYAWMRIWANEMKTVLIISTFTNAYLYKN